MSLKVETSVRDIGGTGKTSYLVRVVYNEQLIAASLVVDRDIREAASNCIVKLESLVEEVKRKMHNAGLLP